VVVVVVVVWDQLPVFVRVRDSSSGGVQVLRSERTWLQFGRLVWGEETGNVFR
jgi:hypothetical protein